MRYLGLRNKIQPPGLRRNRGVSNTVGYCGDFAATVFQMSNPELARMDPRYAPITYRFIVFFRRVSVASFRLTSPADPPPARSIGLVARPIARNRATNVGGGLE